MKHFFVLGNDDRFSLLSRILEEKGYSVKRSVEKRAEDASCYIFSPGTSQEEIALLLKEAREGSVFLCGRKSKGLSDEAKKKNVGLYSLFDDPRYLIKNSLATAEGTLSEVIKGVGRTLPELCILVCGYGNCGKAIADLFFLCGSEVWIHSHEASLLRAAQDGYNEYPSFGENLGMFDVIVNTVPAPIFEDPFFDSLRPGTHFYQIASGFSGICAETLYQKGIVFHPLPGLPGRFAPETEAEAIFEFLQEILKDQSYENQ